MHNDEKIAKMKKICNEQAILCLTEINSKELFQTQENKIKIIEIHMSEVALKILDVAL